MLVSCGTTFVAIFEIIRERSTHHSTGLWLTLFEACQGDLRAVHIDPALEVHVIEIFNDVLLTSLGYGVIVCGDKEFPGSILYVFFPLPLISADLFMQLVICLPSRVELAHKSRRLCR